MKRFGIASVIILILLASTASGQSKSLHGEFKGNPVVKVKSDGTIVKPAKNPAILFQGEVYVPANILQKIGLKFVYDSKAQSVDISKFNRMSVLYTLDMSELLRFTKEYGVDSVQIIASENTHDIVFTLEDNILSLLENHEGLMTTVLYGASAQATTIRIVDGEGNEFTAPSQKVVDFVFGKIQDKELWKSFKLNGEPIENYS
ncbi:hypothetical protein K0T92_04830 [Paenibacillus oenotherae]|uniref:Copper amine oxidase-like N-terminal domain-containing protein n=1 Tax=Paenibacillus oenotherae TaxID=1435645 RepID=A0ABS7D3B0_9BACL|nr:hypothetical protein [Paenibacillus oenotherae]MBW7474057.1 hypothetical protein [Paenibacillus oenotherae]